MTAKFQTIVFSGSAIRRARRRELVKHSRRCTIARPRQVCHSLANEIERQKRFESMSMRARALVTTKLLSSNSTASNETNFPTFASKGSRSCY